MSAGHRSEPADEIPDGLYERTAELVAACTIDHSYDVKTLANRSRDGKVVYEDSSVPKVLPKTGIKPDGTLPWHELSEWILQNEGKSYDDGPNAAHPIATAVEKRRVEELGGDWKEYTSEMDGLISAVDKKEIKNPPPDQDQRVFETMRSATMTEPNKEAPRSWFKINATSDLMNTADAAPEILMYDEIGGYGVGASDFERELKALGDVKKIKLRINSPGGDAFQGIVIHNILKAHPAEIEGHVDGLAASAASHILMAADKRVMPQNTFLVIHEPSGMTYGPPKVHRQMADDLDRVKDVQARDYAAASGQGIKAVKDLMEEDRLMTAKEAKELGYCDDCTGATKMDSTFALDKIPEKYRSIVASIAFEGIDALQPPKQEPTEMTTTNSNVTDAEVKRVADIRALGVEARADEKVIQSAIDSGIMPDAFKVVLAAAATMQPAGPVYGEEEIKQTVELCTIAKVDTKVAMDFITAKTPIDKVRAKLTEMAAAATDSKSVSSVHQNANDESKRNVEVSAEAKRIVSSFEVSDPKFRPDPVIIENKLRINKMLRGSERAAA
jgi:ATP-dependent protease ClpP protease subunit